MNKIVFLFFAISILNIKAEDWPGWFGPERNGIWREEGIVDQFPENGPKVIWKLQLLEAMLVQLLPMVKFLSWTDKLTKVPSPRKTLFQNHHSRK